MKTKFIRLSFLAAVMALWAGCASEDDYSDVNVYGGVSYSSGFYDPWYGGYYGGGGAIIVSPPISRPPRPTHLPARVR